MRLIKRSLSTVKKNKMTKKVKNKKYKGLSTGYIILIPVEMFIQEQAFFAGFQ